MIITNSLKRTMLLNNLQFWLHADQDVVNVLPRDHWFSLNYHRLLRKPTRSELCSFYMPVDIENRPTVLHQRLREAFAFILHEAVRKEDAVNNGEPFMTREEIEGMGNTPYGQPRVQETGKHHHDLQDTKGELALVLRRSKTKSSL